MAWWGSRRRAKDSRESIVQKLHGSAGVGRKRAERVERALRKQNRPGAESSWAFGVGARLADRAVLPLERALLALAALALLARDLIAEGAVLLAPRQERLDRGPFDRHVEGDEA